VAFSPRADHCGERDEAQALFFALAPGACGGTVGSIPASDRATNQKQRP